jgi:exonuclease VII large subunit
MDLAQRRIYTVSELNSTARSLLEREMGEIWVKG